MNKIIDRAIEEARTDWRRLKPWRSQILDKLEKTIALNAEPSQARWIFLLVKRELEAIK